MSLEPLANALANAGVDVLRDHPIGPMTTYRVGGRAALFVHVVDADVLARVVHAAAGTGTAGAHRPMLIVGNGSNLLVADDGFDGLVVHLGTGFETVTVDADGTTVVAGGAAALPIVARRTASLGLMGFEWAVGVPGTIGGAVRMNAGGHGSDMAAVLSGVRVVDMATGETGTMAVSQLGLGYRQSSIRSSMVVVEAQLQLRRGDRAVAEAEVADVVTWRREHQPGGANAGSVFTNPPGDSAGRLIDAAGCKGLRVGTAEVSAKHANFIQADPGGSADDVVALMAEVRRRVVEATGVELIAETRLVGFPDPAAAGGATVTTTIDDEPGTRVRVEVDAEADPVVRIEPKLRARRIEIRRAARRHRRRLVVSAAVVVVLLGLSVGALYSPLLQIRSVSIQGERHLTDSDVLRASGIRAGSRLIDLDAASVARRIRRLPWVREAVVARQWPNAVVIHIVERAAVATVATTSGGRLVISTGGRIAGPAGPFDQSLPLATLPKGSHVTIGTVLSPKVAASVEMLGAMPDDLLTRSMAARVSESGELTLSLKPSGEIWFGDAEHVRQKFLSADTMLAGAVLPQLPAAGRRPDSVGSYPAAVVLNIVHCACREVRP